MDFIKFIAFIVLLLPALAASVLIYMFGGWTQGWDYMPNPVNSLLEWVMN